MDPTYNSSLDKYSDLQVDIYANYLENFIGYHLENTGLRRIVEIVDYNTSKSFYVALDEVPSDKSNIISAYFQLTNQKNLS